MKKVMVCSCMYTFDRSVITKYSLKYICQQSENWSHTRHVNKTIINVGFCLKHKSNGNYMLSI